MVKKLLLAIILALFTIISVDAYAFTNRPSKPPVGARIDPLHHINRGLVAWWLFNDGAGSSLTDITGKHHGTLTTMDANDWVGSPRGGALDFDGTDDYVDVGNSTDFDLTTSFTITGWLNLLSGSSGFRVIMGKGTSAATNYQIYVQSATDKLSYYDQINGENASTYVVPVSVWTFGAVVVNGNSIKIYANSDKVLDTTLASTPPINSTYLAIGRRGDYSASYFSGPMDNIRIYKNRALSADEVAELYRNPYIGLWQRPVKWYSVDDPPASFTPTVTWW